MSDWFEPLDPPPGGLNALRARLRADRRRRFAWAVLATAVIVLVLLARPRPELPTDPGLVAFGLYEPTAPIEGLDRTAATAVYADETTVVYRVASLY